MSSDLGFNNLFELTCSFDPLKAILKKMSDKQKAQDVEIKLLKGKCNVLPI